MSISNRDEKKNILIVVPNLQLGGQQRVAVNTVDILKDVCNITVAIFDSSGAVYEPACEVVDLRIPAKSGTAHKIWNVCRRAIVLRRLKKARKIDVSYSYGSTANLANVLSKSRGKTVIRFSSYRDVEGGTQGNLAYRLSDSMVCCSRKLYVDMLQKFPQFQKKIFCLQNPYNENYLIARGEEGVNDFSFGAHVVVAHGRLDEVKNYPRLIKAFSLVRQEVPDAQLLIIGGGAMRPKLEQIISDYGLSESVTLAGFRENPFAYLSKAAVYVMSSYVEGFPNALVEGMHFLPVVSVDCKSGPREILSEGDLDAVCTGIEEADYGILVSPAEKREWNPKIMEEDRVLAEGILRLLKDSGKRRVMQERAKERAEQFGYDSYRKRFLEIIEK